MDSIEAIDMLKIYLRLETYEVYDERGNLTVYQEINMYYMYNLFKGPTKSRMFLINLETGDRVEINQDGKAKKQYTYDKNILSVNYLYSFKDSLDKVIKSTKAILENEENGQDTLDYFMALKNHMDIMTAQDKPAYLEFNCLNSILEIIGDIYVLGYGNPLTNKSRIQCLNEYRNNI